MSSTTSHDRASGEKTLLAQCVPCASLLPTPKVFVVQCRYLDARRADGARNHEPLKRRQRLQAVLEKALVDFDTVLIPLASALQELLHEQGDITHRMMLKVGSATVGADSSAIRVHTPGYL